MRRPDAGMTTKEQDTDPSTPGAMRGLAPTDPTPAPIAAAAHVPTDPGVGPPSQPPMASAMPVHRTPPMGIVVPASARVSPTKDSVELLLDGMHGPQPERPKTMPQTDGQSSASYHAEHMVRPARTSPDEEPKVVVERPPQAPTTRIDRAKVQAVIEAAEARQRAMEATAVVPQQIAPRVIVAIVAGVMVVLALFVVFRLAKGNLASTTAASTPAASKPPVVAVVAPPATVAATPAATQPTASADPAASTAPAETAGNAASRPSASPATPSWANPSAKPRTPRAAPGAPTGSGDIGEFKTTFH
jgi:hypothetical protein